MQIYTNKEILDATQITTPKPENFLLPTKKEIYFLIPTNYIIQVFRPTEDYFTDILFFTV